MNKSQYKHKIYVGKDFHKMFSGRKWGVQNFRKYLYPRSLLPFVGVEISNTSKNWYRDVKYHKRVNKVSFKGFDLTFDEFAKIESSLEKTFVDLKRYILYTNSDLMARATKKQLLEYEE